MRCDTPRRSALMNKRKRLSTQQTFHVHYTVAREAYGGQPSKTRQRFLRPAIDWERAAENNFFNNYAN